MLPNENPITVSLDMATEFYLGMYRVDGESSAATCWLKHSADGGWKISIMDFNLRAGRDERPCFRPSGQGSIFGTKERALEVFTQWTRQGYDETVELDAFEQEMELRISNLKEQVHSEHAWDERLGVEFALAHYRRLKMLED